MSYVRIDVSLLCSRYLPSTTYISGKWQVKLVDNNWSKRRGLKWKYRITDPILLDSNRTVVSHGPAPSNSVRRFLNRSRSKAPAAIAVSSKPPKLRVREANRDHPLGFRKRYQINLSTSNGDGGLEKRGEAIHPLLAQSLQRRAIRRLLWVRSHQLLSWSVIFDGFVWFASVIDRKWS